MVGFGEPTNKKKTGKRRICPILGGGVPKVGQCPTFSCFCYLMAPLRGGKGFFSNSMNHGDDVLHERSDCPPPVQHGGVPWID